MPNVVNSFQNCYKNLVNGFTTYDQAVDVVSCIESIFRYAYKDELLYFDRFPSIPPTNLTPDFTVLFQGDYGLVFEVKRTFPQDDLAFEKEINQLLSYDNVIELKSSDDGQRAKPAIHDIVLVISADNSNEIFNRINHLLREKANFRFRNNIIFMEYFYNTNDSESHYVFRKFLGENRGFRDESLPEDKRLEYQLGEKGKSFKCYPKHFIKYKVNEVLCNDKPYELYMSVFLWTKVFYSYLDAEQKLEWNRGNPRKIQTIILKIDQLLANLNINYIPKGNVRKKWLTDTIDFLQDADLAVKDSDETATIYFCNLNKKIGGKAYFTSDGVAEKYEIGEYGRLIADQYCNNLNKKRELDKKTKMSAKKQKQITFNDALE